MIIPKKSLNNKSNKKYRNSKNSSGKKGKKGYHYNDFRPCIDQMKEMKKMISN